MGREEEGLRMTCSLRRRSCLARGGLGKQEIVYICILLRDRVAKRDVISVHFYLLPTDWGCLGLSTLFPVPSAGPVTEQVSVNTL